MRISEQFFLEFLMCPNFFCVLVNILALVKYLALTATMGTVTLPSTVAASTSSCRQCADASRQNLHLLESTHS